MAYANFSILKQVEALLMLTLALLINQALDYSSVETWRPLRLSAAQTIWDTSNIRCLKKIKSRIYFM